MLCVINTLRGATCDSGASLIGAMSITWWRPFEYLNYFTFL